MRSSKIIILLLVLLVNYTITAQVETTITKRYYCSADVLALANLNCITNEAPKRNSTASVVNKVTGRVWMDRNLGASQVAKATSDFLAYGSLFQWGRLDDGHQIIKHLDANTAVPVDTIHAKSATSIPGHNKYIVDGKSIDWLTELDNNLWQGIEGGNNPCPAGYRIPTSKEWFEEKSTWSSNDIKGAFNSSLKLTPAGIVHTSGIVMMLNVAGNYQSSTIKGAFFDGLIILSSNAFIGSENYRSMGYSIRCIKD